MSISGVWSKQLISQGVFPQNIMTTSIFQWDLPLRSASLRRRSGVCFRARVQPTCLPIGVDKWQSDDVIVMGKCRAPRMCIGQAARGPRNRRAGQSGRILIARGAIWICRARVDKCNFEFQSLTQLDVHSRIAEQQHRQRIAKSRGLQALQLGATLPRAHLSSKPLGVSVPVWCSR